VKLAISNIAWDAREDEAVAELLQQYNVNAIDIAPSKYFPKPMTTQTSEILRVRDWWAEKGIAVTGMQSLLFGMSHFNVFGSEAIRAEMLSYLDAICRIGGTLGARYLVFGSPKQRDRSGVNDVQTREMAVAFFRRLGDIAGSHKVTICLEPNPICYGANFMTTSDETAEVVKQVDHPSIRMQLDTGAVTINREDSDMVLQKYGSLMGHIHASEPNLVPLGDGETDHHKFAAGIGKHLADRTVSIEMLSTSPEAHSESIERALIVAKRHYGNHGTS